jgi:hypothetical protein
MKAFIFLLTLQLLLECAILATVHAEHVWNVSLLQSCPSVGPARIVNTTARVQNNTCVLGCKSGKEYVNEYLPYEKYKPRTVSLKTLVNGTTVYINEYMGYGHFVYDIWLLQILHSMRVDRIILQRAACLNNLCDGVGTFEAFYKGYYRAAIAAFHPDIPLFMRFSPEEELISPLYLAKPNAPQPRLNDNIVLPYVKCFENVVSRACKSCFYPSVSPEAVQRFKQKAYEIADREMGSALVPYIKADVPLRITVVSQHVTDGQNTRGPMVMENLDYFRNKMGEAFSATAGYELLFESISYTSSSSQSEDDPRRYYQDIHLAAVSQVIIAEHSPFEGNMIYMRNGTLFIELRGDGLVTEHSRFTEYEKVGRTFGVFHVPFNVNDIVSMSQPVYTIMDGEIGRIIDIIRDYEKHKPYAFNMKW